MENILVTSYQNPDLDGTACMVAYAEFLKAYGKSATPGYLGSLQAEVNFVLEEFNFVGPELVENYYKGFDKFVLVDLNDLASWRGKIDPQNVIEVIDHHSGYKAGRFPKAKVQIELIGAAATLVAERFFNLNLQPRKQSATLLYLGIVSNTINFKGKLTSIKDKKMADWLKSQLDLPADIIRRMFRYKSEIKVPLEQAIQRDLKSFVFGQTKIGIAQFELVDLGIFVSKNKKELEQILERISNENNFDYTFLTAIDIEKGYNIILAIDEKTEKMLTKLLKIVFNNNFSTTKKIIMRKQIVNLLEKEFGIKKYV